MEAFALAMHRVNRRPSHRAQLALHKEVRPDTQHFVSFSSYYNLLRWVLFLSIFKIKYLDFGEV